MIQNPKPHIIFQDDYIVVLDKPAGMVVNRVDTVKEVETLQDWVESEFRIPPPTGGSEFRNEEEKGFIERSGIVHRLDKETSGLILVARDYIPFLDLQKQFKEGKVEKTYIALAHGKVVPEEGEINVPVGRLPWDRIKFGVIPMGRESRTLYRVLEYKILRNGKNVEDLTLLELHPKTGRTHQIRVHLRYIGHPVFADSLYAGRKNIKSDRKLLNRHFLHAAKIKFFHPARNASQTSQVEQGGQGASVVGRPIAEQAMEFESPLPAELKSFVLTLN